MVYGFKRTKYSYITLSIFAIILATLLYLPISVYEGGSFKGIFRHIPWLDVPVSNMIWGIIRWILMIFLFVIIEGLVCEFIAKYIYSRIIYTFNDNCDVDEYLEKHRKVLNHKITSKEIPQLNFAIGWSEKGDYTRALRIVENTIYSKRFQKLSAYPKTIGYIILSDVYLEKKDKDSAISNLATLNEHLSKIKSITDYEAARRRIIDQEYKIQILNGEYESALNYFQISLKYQQFERGRVRIHYILADLYSKIGDNEKANEHYQYVALHGNTLKIAEEARYVLAK